MAANIVKQNNADNLNLTSSWVGGAVPGSGDVAVFDNTLTSGATNLLGATMYWGGIKVLNPGGSVTVSAGNVLTNGIFGIDMSAATQDLILSNTVNIAPDALQRWTVAPGRNLILTAVPAKWYNSTRMNSGVVQVDTTGTVMMGSAASTIIFDANSNPFITYGDSDWAALDSSGKVIAASYSSSASGNFDVTADTSVGTVAVDSERFNDPTPRTLTITGTSTHTARGILVTPNSGGGTITGGNLRPNRSSTAGAALTVIQNSASDFTIASTLAVGSSSTPVDLVKCGPGHLILSSAFNNTGGINGNGGITINGGKLTATTPQALGAGFVKVNKGKLAFSSGAALTPAVITLADGTTNQVNVVAADSQARVTNMIFNAGSTHLEFNYANGVAPSTTTAPLLATNLTVNATITIDLYNGSMTTGIFPLVKTVAPFSSGSFAAFTLGFLPPRVTAVLSNDIANSSIDLIVTSVNQPIKWATGNGTWNTTLPNWQDSLGASTTYIQSAVGDSVLFEDTVSGSSPITVTLNDNLAPASTTVNASKNYTLSGTGAITGLGGITKAGSGTLTLSTINTFSGGINLNGGMVSFTTISNLGAAAINFSGGGLQYNGNTDDISVRTVTFNSGGATIDTGADTISFANPVGNNGTGGLTKAGSGALVLSGTNTYSGPTVVANGILALSNTNVWITNSSSIIISNAAVLDAVPANGLILGGAAHQQLRGFGTVNGGVIAGDGTSISPGIAAGTLTIANGLTVSGATLLMDISTNAADRDLLMVNGALTLNNGTLQLVPSTPLTNGTYTLVKYFSINGAAANFTLVGFAQGGKSASLSSVSGEIRLTVADSASDNLVWSGSASANWNLSGVQNWLNGATPWSYTNGDIVTFNDVGASQPTVSIAATVQPASVLVSNVAVTTYTFADGGGKISGPAGLTKSGSGSLVINTINDNFGNNSINNGTVQVNGAIGTGNITNNSILIFQQTADNVVPGKISGAGSLTQQGSAKLVISGDNTYTGPTTITSGNLQVGDGGSTGSLGASVVTNNSTLIVNRSGTYALNNNVSGSGQLIVNGGGTVSLGGTQAYLGNTFISNGIVKLSASEKIPDAGTVPGSTGWLVLDGGVSAGRFDLNGFNETVNALSGNAGTVNGVITNSGASGTSTLTIGTAATIWNGSISDSATGAKTKVVLLGTNSMRFNADNPYTGGTVVGDSATLIYANGATVGGATGDLTISNGATLFLQQAGGSPNVNNNIIVPDNATARYDSSVLGNLISGNFNGGPNSTNLITGAAGLTFGNLTVKQLQNFLGTIRIQSGSSLRFFGNVGTLNGGDDTTFELESNSTMFVRSGGTIYLGALTGYGTIAGGSFAGTATYVIGSKNTDSTFNGAILNGPPTTNNAIVKTGIGTLTLSGSYNVISNAVDEDTFDIYTNRVLKSGIDYLGNTTVSNGILRLIAPNNVPSNSPIVMLASSTAVLDVSRAGIAVNEFDPNITVGGKLPQGYVTNSYVLTNGTFTLTTNQTLTGIGIVNGRVVSPANSTVSVGLPTGILTITTNATLSGFINMSLDTTNSITSSRLSSPSINVTGAILVVTNIGPDIVNGTTFQLFSQGVTGFGSITLPNTDPTGSSPYVWSTNLAANGSIQLVSGGASGISTNSPVLNSSFSSGVLTLSWPPDHLGWKLQSQTNSLSTGIGTNWVDVVGSDSATNALMTLNPTNPTVFYRLIYLVP